jgi:hypothetical protein
MHVESLHESLTVVNKILVAHMVMVKYQTKSYKNKVNTNIGRLSLQAENVNSLIKYIILYFHFYCTICHSSILSAR